MTEEEKARKVSKIKRINERLAALGRDPDIGKDSEYYQRFKNAILLSIPEAARTGSGTISRSEKTLDLVPDEALDALSKQHTVGDIKARAREEVAAEHGINKSQVTKEMVSDYIKTVDEVLKYLGNLTKGDSDIFDTYWRQAGAGAPKPTYTILKDIIDNKEEIDGLRAEGNEDEADYIEDKLFKRIKAKVRDIQEVLFG